MFTMTRTEFRRDYLEENREHLKNHSAKVIRMTLTEEYNDYVKRKFYEELSESIGEIDHENRQYNNRY